MTILKVDGDRGNSPPPGEPVSSFNRISQMLNKQWKILALYFMQIAFTAGCYYLLGKVSLYIGISAIATTFIIRSIWWSKGSPSNSPPLAIPRGGVESIESYFLKQTKNKQEQLRMCRRCDFQADFLQVPTDRALQVEIKDSDSLEIAQEESQKGNKVVLVSVANPTCPGNGHEGYLCRHTTLKKSLDTILGRNRNYPKPLTSTSVFISPQVDVIGMNKQGCHPFSIAVISWAANMPKSSQGEDAIKSIQTVLQAAITMEGCDTIIFYVSAGDKRAESFKNALKENGTFLQQYKKIIFYSPDAQVLESFQSAFIGQ